MTLVEVARTAPFFIFAIAVVGECILRSFGLAAIVGAFSRRSKYTVGRRPFFSGQFKNELHTTLKVLAFDCLVVGSCAMLGLMPHEHVGLTAHVVTFFAFLVWFEIWFYVTHRLMHTKPMWRFHAQHHSAGTPGPLTAFSFSLVERAVLLTGTVGAACVAAQFLPVSEPGVLAYVLFNTAINIVGHCNADLFPMWMGRSGVFVTTTYHAMHHDHGDRNFGLFFVFLDRWFGTEIKNWQERFLAVKAGKRL